MPTLYIIDANAYVHRAYHALPPLTTSKGEMVNAVYGFIRMMLKIIRTEKPEYLAVCFDYPAKTFRHKAYAEYKATRKKLDDELKNQMPIVREVARVLNLPMLEKEGFEADDIIATLARSAKKDGAEVVVVSADKDALQLVEDGITVFNEPKNLIMDREAVREKYGLYPDKLVDMFALMGDASDNVPGVKGIGEKTAVKLIQKYGSVETLIKEAPSLDGKLKETITAHAADAERSKMLVTLDDHVDLERTWSSCKPGPADEKTVIDFLCRYEFTSLVDEIVPKGAPSVSAVEKRGFETRVVADKQALDALVAKIAGSKRLSVDLETTGVDPLKADMVGLSFAVDADGAWYIPVGHAYLGVPSQLDLKTVLSSLKPVLENEKIPKYGHNIKYDLLVLKRYGIVLGGIHFDTMVASYCLNPSRNTHNLKGVALDYLGMRMTEISELIGKGAKQITMDMVEIEKAAPYAAADAVAVLRLADKLEPELKEKKIDRLFHDIEMPLVAILADMERLGAKIDVPYLEGLAKEFGRMIENVQSDIFRLAGEEFNPNSPKQLSVILFEKLKLPAIRRTKTGYCTDEEVLRTLAGQHDLPAKLMEYRELRKLKSTYIDGLLEAADKGTQRVHSSFNQTVTATGRLSSSEPNLQNIPIRSEYGRKIRKAFIPEGGHIFVSADYSQIDLRVLAHISGDTALVKAFREGEDIHRATASEVFGVPAAEVGADLRRIAKSINFGIVYGMSSFSLSQQLNIAPAKAKEYIDNYFKRYSGVKEWMEKIVKDARRSGFVATLLGRIRYLPEINSTNAQIRGFAERTALNTPIQGTSADIIKKAMIDLCAALGKAGLRSRMLVQVHDELLFEVPASEADRVTPLIKQKMEEAVKLDVPVIVDLKTGADWNDMEKLKAAV